MNPAGPCTWSRGTPCHWKIRKKTDRISPFVKWSGKPEKKNGQHFPLQKWSGFEGGGFPRNSLVSTSQGLPSPHQLPWWPPKREPPGWEALGPSHGGLDGNNPPTPLPLAESPGGGGWQPWLAAKDEVTKVVAVHHPLLLAEPPGGGGGQPWPKQKKTRPGAPPAWWWW